MSITRKYWPVWVLVVAMFFAWLSWGMVLNNISPIASPDVGIPLFYATAFFSGGLTFCAFSALFRIAFFPNSTVADHVSGAIRQGLVFALVLLGIMIFQQFRILTWWIGTMIVLMGLFVEAFFWSRPDIPK